jgi:HlyD family secretion protein
MIQITGRRVLVAGAALLVLAAMVYMFLPDPVPVQTATVRRGPMQVILEEEGRTEVADRYAVTAPVTAYLRRIELETGDPVEAGQPVARLEPPRTPVRDPSGRAEAEARVRAAEATSNRAIADRERTERLVAGGAATPQALEQAISEAERATAELEAARATLARSGGEAPLEVAEVLRAPVAGRVLALGRRSAGQVNPGDTLVVIGDTEQLEIRVDVLSQDAVRLRAGTPVLLEQWGGETPLQAVVRRVEPQGFTSISSLGVEEQRVGVVAGFESPAAAWADSLGAGYRVLARFVVWQADDVLQVPSSALFRVGEEWAVFVVEDDRAVRRTVTLGQQSGLVAQVTDGLSEGEVVIVHPSNDVEDGIEVDPQEEEGSPPS